MVEQSLKLSVDVIHPPPNHYPNTCKHLAPLVNLDNRFCCVMVLLDFFLVGKLYLANADDIAGPGKGDFPLHR